MTLITNKVAAATAVAAVFSVAATPSAAIELPRVAGQVQAWDPDALNVENRRHHRGHRDDGWDIDGDDILAGVLILGGIAAIAGIANAGKNRPPAPPEPEPWPADAGYQAPPSEDFRSGGMARAVDTCVGEVEASRGPVITVDRASRSGEGWYVAGELDGGTPYACWVDGSGQVSDIEAGDYGASYAPATGDELAEVALDSVHKQAAAEAGNALTYKVAQADD